MVGGNLANGLARIVGSLAKAKRCVVRCRFLLFFSCTFIFVCEALDLQGSNPSGLGRFQRGTQVFFENCDSARAEPMICIVFE